MLFRSDYAKDIPKEVYFSEHNVNDITVAKKLINIMFLFFKPPEQYQYYNYLQKQKIKKLDIKCQNQLTLKFTGH